MKSRSNHTVWICNGSKLPISYKVRSATNKSRMTSTNKGTSAAPQDKLDPRGNNTTTAYIIAGITLGAAIGNMFLAGRIRNVMKINIPRNDAWRGGSTSSTHSSSSAGSGAHTRSSRSDGSTRTEHMKSSTAPLDHNSLPFAIRSHLKVLGLPQEVTDEKRIKDAYRAVVMKYHPDRIPIHTSRDNNGLKDDDSHALRLQYESKFKEVTDSYNSLMAYFTKA